MQVNELFYSLQGEGILAGVPSVFIRLAGCPLRCRWCDTKYAWDYASGRRCEPEQIIEEVARWACKHVVITGGEPLVEADLSPRAGLADLTARLKDLGLHVTVETSGVAFVDGLACDLMSISPKLRNAGIDHGDSPPDLEPLRQLIAAYASQLKFVVGSAADVGEIHQIVDRLEPPNSVRVMLMPQAVTRDELLGRSPAIWDLCKDTGWQFCQRLHVLLWNAQRGT